MAALTMVLQVASLVGMAGIVVVCAAVWRRWPMFWYLAVGPGAWGAFGVVYYAFLLAGRLSAQAVFLWGAAHRLMAVILIFGIAALLWAVLSEPDGPPIPPDDWGDDYE